MILYDFSFSGDNYPMHVYVTIFKFTNSSTNISNISTACLIIFGVTTLLEASIQHTEVTVEQAKATS